jgi:hypothetical protein
MAPIATPPPLPATQAPAAIPASTPAALDAQQVQELLDAQARVAKLRRASNVARFNGWTTGFFALLTILTGFTAASSMLLGTGMAIAAYVEFTGGAKLRRLAPRAAQWLAINQACLGAILIAYSLWQLHAAMTGASPYAAIASTDPQMAHMLAPVENLTRTVSATVYAVLIVIAICMQGGTALYYLSRQRLLRAYVDHTPKWILDLQRAGVAV